MSDMRQWLEPPAGQRNIGSQAYLPAMLSGWGIALLISGGLLLLWYALLRYNESTEIFPLMS